MSSPARLGAAWLRRALAETGRRRLAAIWRRELAEGGRRPRALDDAALPPGPVVVLAPHVDDETLGAGATLLRHVARGDRVQVIYLTDSAGSRHPRLSRSELAQVRRREGTRLAEACGFAPPLWAGGRDGHLAEDVDRVATQVAQVWAEVRPRTVYLPALLDAHPDHVHAFDVLERLQARTPRQDEVRVMAMQLHTPLGLALTTAWVEAGPYWARKLAALETFSSQTMFFGNFLALQTALASVTDGGGPAEPFVDAPLEPYLGAGRQALGEGEGLAVLRSVSGYRNLTQALRDAEPGRRRWLQALAAWGVVEAP